MHGSEIDTITSPELFVVWFIPLVHNVRFIGRYCFCHYWRFGNYLIGKHDVVPVSSWNINIRVRVQNCNPNFHKRVLFNSKFYSCIKFIKYIFSFFSTIEKIGTSWLQLFSKKQHNLLTWSLHLQINYLWT